MAQFKAFKPSESTKPPRDTLNLPSLKYLAHVAYKTNSAVANNNTQTVYTVPDGKVFVVLAITCGYRYIGAGTGGVCRVSADNWGILWQVDGSNQYSHESLSIPFSKGLPFPPGCKFQVMSGAADQYVYCSVIGYETDDFSVLSSVYY